MPNEFSTGFVNLPSPRFAVAAVDVGLALGDAAAPEDYVVPAYRHWFGPDFRPIRENVHTLMAGGKPVSLQNRLDGSSDDFDQKQIGKCPAMGMAVQKASVEGRPISTRDGWRLAKIFDLKYYGLPLTSYGATGWGAADAFVDGICDESLSPSHVKDGETAIEHQRVVETPEIDASRERNRGKRSYIVYRQDFQKALISTGHPVVTFCDWFTADNAITSVMGVPDGKSVGGHMFACIGWLSASTVKKATGLDIGAERAYVMVNSWGRAWGWRGMFLVPDNHVFQRIGPMAWVHVDADKATLAELLAKYDGKNVRLPGTPDIWRCELGVLRRFPDELVWWAHGYLFGYDAEDITADDFAGIPKGRDMDMTDAPFRTRELVRQIRQFCGKS